MAASAEIFCFPPPQCAITTLRIDRGHMIIRAASKDDIPRIIQLARELAEHVRDPDPGSAPAELLDAAFGAGRYCELIVADAPDGVVGFAAFSHRYELHTACRSVWLSDLVVSKAVRGRKIGELLLEAVKTRAVELGARKIVFDVWAHNTSALRFYGRQAASKVQEIDTYEIDLTAI